MRRKILIYNGWGADSYGVSSLSFTLNLLNINKSYSIELANKDTFKDRNWQNSSALLIFPGGRDTPYQAILQGEANKQIVEFVKSGGNFLGICAGAYYASSFIEFEKGTALEICAARELGFFPGIARGPAYGFGKFCYNSQKGARIAKLSFTNELSIKKKFHCYYNGGCTFVDAEKFAGVSTLFSYDDLEEYPAAVIHITVGSGNVILSGVHPEYTIKHPEAASHFNKKLFISLKKAEASRSDLFHILMSKLLLL